MNTYVISIADKSGGFGAALEKVLRDVLAPNPQNMAMAGVAVMRGEDFSARVEADARQARAAWRSQTKRKRSAEHGKS